MSFYSNFNRYSTAERDFYDGMSADDAAEMRSLLDSLYKRFEQTEFILTPAAYDAVAIAKLDQDLEALRIYERLIVVGVHPNDVKNAVIASKSIPGGCPDMNMSHVNSFVAVQKATKDAVPYPVGKKIKELSILFPDQADLLIELVMERQVRDIEQIEAVLAQGVSTATPLQEGLI